MQIPERMQGGIFLTRTKPCAECEGCPLYKRPFVSASVRENPTAILIGEAPGETEVEKGMPFVGRSGELLDKWLLYLDDKMRIYGFPFRREDVSIYNAVSCRPSNNATPGNKEIEYCGKTCLWPMLTGVVTREVPVILLGRVAERSFCMATEQGCFTEKGWQVYLLKHPAYYLRKQSLDWKPDLDGLCDAILKNLYDKKKKLPLIEYDTRRWHGGKKELRGPDTSR